MDKQPTHNAQEHELARWLLDRLPRPTDEQCIGELDLASYVDGLASARDLERVEAHLASCSRCRRALLDARRPLGKPAAPEGRFVERVRRLVPGRRPSRWRRVAGRVAAAAAVAATGLAGLQAGSALRRGRLSRDSVVLAEVTFGSGEPLAAGDLLEDLPTQVEEPRR